MGAFTVEPRDNVSCGLAYCEARPDERRAAQIPASTLSVEHGSAPPRLTRLLRHATRIDHRRIHRARRNAVGANTVCAVIDRNGVSHRNYRAQRQCKR